MTHYHHTPQGLVAFTPEEETAWAAAAADAALPNALDLFKARRDRAVNAGVAHNGHTWQTDPPSQHAMASAVTLGTAYEDATGQPWSTKWKTASGYVTVNLTQLVTAGLVVGAHVQACFAREDELIDQATGGDVSGALADIENGWPG